MPLGPCRVRPLLQGRFSRPLYLYAESCSSTQDLLPADAPEGTLGVAETQTRGRGRRGRVWEAGPGSSLLFSLCLRPPVEEARLPTLTVAAAEAIAATVEAAGAVEVTVKEPNDVLVSGKKVAGLIAEAAGGRVALGIGLNVSQSASELPARPIFPATSLALEMGAPPDRVQLLVALLARLEERYALWLDEAVPR